MASGAVAHARDFEMGGDNQYPYSIMAPEPGTVPHHRGPASRKRHGKAAPEHAAPLARQPVPRTSFVAPGSSGSVLPTQLPRTPLMPPEGGGALIIHPLPQEQGRTVLPGGTSVPNLPHGTETFQDRAARCSFQAGLYGVPNGTSPQQYMGACVQ